jgi:hypothetical protein
MIPPAILLLAIGTLISLLHADDAAVVASLSAAKAKVSAIRDGGWAVDLGDAHGLSEAVWTQLGQLAGIRRVSGNGAQFDDHALARIAKIATIETLFFNGPSFTDAGLAVLATMPRLHSFGVDHSTVIVGSGLAPLQGASQVTTLHFGGCVVGDEGVRTIAQLIQLEDIGLGHTRITRASFPLLAAMPALARLELTPNWDPQPYTAADLAAFATMARLRELELHDMVLPWDNGLDHLAMISSLTTLKLYWCYISAADLAKIKAGLPAVTLDIRNPAGEDRLKQYNERLDKLHAGAVR